MRLRYIFNIFAFLMFASSANAQTVQIGRLDFPGISTNTYGPMNTWLGSAPLTRANRHATIYPLDTLNLIPNNAMITGIQYYRNVTSLSGGNGANGAELKTATTTTTGWSLAPTFRVHLENTTLNTYSAVVDWAANAANGTLVFNGDPTTFVGNSTGWVTVPFITPHCYNGKNLAIYTQYTQSASTAAAAGFTGNSIVWSYDTIHLTTPTPAFPNPPINHFNSTQSRYNAPVTALPFATNTTGSNIRHPSIKIMYDVTLPVKLVSFNAKAKKNTTELVWRSSFTQNIRHFVVQKSLDTKAWYSIGTVAAEDDLDGDTYRFTDADASPLAYYRLHSMERDGTFEQSAIVTVSHNSKQKDFVVYPTIARDEVLVSNKSEGVISYQLFDTNGRLLKSFQNETNAPYILIVSDLESGIYFLKAISEHNETVEKIVKP
jgi:hypothetical protein